MGAGAAGVEGGDRERGGTAPAAGRLLGLLRHHQQRLAAVHCKTLPLLCFPAAALANEIVLVSPIVKVQIAQQYYMQSAAPYGSPGEPQGARVPKHLWDLTGF